MAKKKGKKCGWFTSDDVLVETHVKNSITGHECISKRDLKRSCVPLLDAILRIVLALGLIVALIFLAKSMESVALMKLSKSYDDCILKSIEMTNRLHVASAHLQAYSKQMNEMANRLDKMESMLRKIEQRPYVLKTEGCCHGWCNYWLWEVERQ